MCVCIYMKNNIYPRLNFSFHNVVSLSNFKIAVFRNVGDYKSNYGCSKFCEAKIDGTLGHGVGTTMETENKKETVHSTISKMKEATFAGRELFIAKHRRETVGNRAPTVLR